jgi:hypothetical protein
MNPKHPLLFITYPVCGIGLLATEPRGRQDHMIDAPTFEIHWLGRGEVGQLDPLGWKCVLG